jgi:hypothetical protein
MKPFKWLLWTVVSGLIGAFLISVLAHYTFAVTAPKMQYDGQYGMLFMLTFPVGWMVGAGLYGATIFAAPEEERPPRANCLFASLYTGGCLLMPFVPLACLRLLWLLFSRR